MSENGKQMASRRTVLKSGTAATLGGVALAGCLGNGNGNGNGNGGNGNGNSTDGNGTGNGNATETNEFEWPPSNGVVEMVSGNEAGTTPGTFTQLYADHLHKHVPDGDDVSFQIDHVTGAGGTRHANWMVDRQDHGGHIIGHAPFSSIANPVILNPNVVNYDMSEFRYVAQTWDMTRAMSFNPRSFDVPEHFVWEWDDIRENWSDLRFALVGEGHGSTILTRLMTELHDDLETPENNMIQYGGGSEARAAIERGEADVYMGSFGGNYYREEYYTIQLVIQDPRNKSTIENINAVAGEDGHEPIFIDPDTDFDQVDAQTIVDLSMERYFFYMPPGTSQEAWEFWVDAFESLYEDEELHQDIEDTLGDLRVNFSPTAGEELEGLVDGMMKARHENEDLLTGMMPDD